MTDKKRKLLEEFHEEMPEDMLRVLYGRLGTDELRKILEKFKKCKSPDGYMLLCTRVVEEELSSRK